MKDSIKRITGGVFVGVLVLALAGGFFLQERSSNSDEPAIPKSLTIVACDTPAPLLGAYIKSRNPRLPRTLVKEIAEELIRYCTLRQLPLALVVAIVDKESEWNPLAVSPANARGLMQILRCDGIEIDPSTIHDIDYNLDVGTSIFAKKLQITKGDLMQALDNYSGGAQGYSDDVLRGMGRYVLYVSSERAK